MWQGLRSPVPQELKEWVTFPEGSADGHESHAQCAPGVIWVCSQVSGQPSNGFAVSSHAWHSEQESGLLAALMEADLLLAVPLLHHGSHTSAAFPRC